MWLQYGTFCCRLDSGIMHWKYVGYAVLWNQGAECAGVASGIGNLVGRGLNQKLPKGKVG